MIEVRGLVHRPISSGSRPERSPALLDGIALTLSLGESLLLTGRNGSGKTTLARYLAGLLIPAAGSVLVDGLDTRDLSRLREVRRRVGFLFQESHDQMVAQTLREEVAFGLENLAFSPQEMRWRALAALERVGLGAQADETIESLTPAERQRLALAGLLAMEPTYFILDEPDTAADAQGLKLLAALIAELRATGHGVLLISHRVAWENLCDRKLVLDQGQLTHTKVAHPHPVPRSGEPNPLAPFPKRKGEEALTPAFSYPSPVLTGEGLEVRAEVILEAQNLTFAYDSKGKPLVRDFSARVGRGEFIVLQGASGAGKSTLVQLLAGLEEPAQGDLLVQGKPIDQLDAAARVRYVGLVFQEPRQQLLGESVAAELELGLAAQGLNGEEREERARWACELVGLDGERWRDRSSATLSGGEQARLAIAAICALDPQVLILDETLAALDPEGQAQLLAALQVLHQRGKTILLVTSSGFEEYATRLWVLDRGQLVYDGPPPT